MTFFRLLFVAALISFAVHLYQQHQESAALRDAKDTHGFMLVPMPSNAVPNTVYIFAPLNCPKENAQRAAALAAKLNELGIPNIRTSHYGAQTFESTEENLAAFKRLDVVMRGEIPIALINGMGKANPTIEEVISEYNQTRNYQ